MLSGINGHRYQSSDKRNFSQCLDWILYSIINVETDPRSNASHTMANRGMLRIKIGFQMEYESNAMTTQLKRLSVIQQGLFGTIYTVFI